MPRTVIGEPRDMGRLLRFLEHDKVRNAYHIGATQDGYKEQTRFFWVTSHDEPAAVLAIYKGLSAPAVFCAGDPEQVALLVSRLKAQLPGRMLIHRYPEYAAAFADLVLVKGSRRVVRMVLTVDSFRPVPGDREVARLSHRDTAEIIGLYTYYPDNFFEPYQLESGFYRGIKEDGKLVSVAGVHMVAPEMRLAMLGNIVTAPVVRGRGYAELTTSRLCTELLEHADTLVLDVPKESAAAVAAFTRLGFRERFYYDQVLAHRGTGTGWVDDD